MHAWVNADPSSGIPLIKGCEVVSVVCDQCRKVYFETVEDFRKYSKNALHVCSARCGRELVKQRESEAKAQ
jgi:hypothetical protein